MLWCVVLFDCCYHFTLFYGYDIRTHFYAGYEEQISIFDLHRPGREIYSYSTIQTSTLPHRRKRRRTGLNGIISTMDTNPAFSNDYLLAGSYSGQIAIYDTRTNLEECILLSKVGMSSSLNKFNSHGIRNRTSFCIPSPFLLAHSQI